MTDFAFNSALEINEYVLTLKGTALAQAARDLDIPGRSKLNADATRDAILNELVNRWRLLRLRNAVRDHKPLESDEELIVAEYSAGDVPEYEETESQDEAERTVMPAESGVEASGMLPAGMVWPNRASRRAARKNRKLRNDGKSKGASW